MNLRRTHDKHNGVEYDIIKPVLVAKDRKNRAFQEHRTKRSKNTVWGTESGAQPHREGSQYFSRLNILLILSEQMEKSI